MSDLREELDRLGAALNQGGVTPDPEAAADPSGCVVVIPAGGFGYRMRGAGADAGAVTQKALLPLPNGETLISRLVRQYAEAGFRRFVALVNYEGKEVEAHLEGGRPWDVDARCSYDPESAGSGRTGAMLHAMAQGIMPPDLTTIVHNADCPVYRYSGSFPLDLINTHATAVANQGAAATVVAVSGYPHPYTGMAIRQGRVTSVEMYPFIPVPAHTGITVLSPGALESVRHNAARSKKNFESDFFALWASEGRLAALLLSPEQWIAVDDRKAYRIFSQALEAGE